MSLSNIPPQTTPLLKPASPPSPPPIPHDKIITTSAPCISLPAAPPPPPLPATPPSHTPPSSPTPSLTLHLQPHPDIIQAEQILASIETTLRTPTIPSDPTQPQPHSLHTRYHCLEQLGDAYMARLVGYQLDNKTRAVESFQIVERWLRKAHEGLETRGRVLGKLGCAWYERGRQLQGELALADWKRGKRVLDEAVRLGCKVEQCVWLCRARICQALYWEERGQEVLGDWVCSLESALEGDVEDGMERVGAMVALIRGYLQMGKSTSARLAREVLRKLDGELTQLDAGQGELDKVRREVEELRVSLQGAEKLVEGRCGLC